MWNRRQWLQTSLARTTLAAAGGLGVAAGWLAGGAPHVLAQGPVVRGLVVYRPAKLQSGFSLYGVTDLPFPKALAFIAECGFGGVELPLMPGGLFDPLRLTAADRTLIRAQLEAESLDLQAVMENLPTFDQRLPPTEEERRLRQAIQLSRDVSPDSRPLVETILGGKPGEWQRLQSFAIDQLARWERLARTEDAIIAIKPHIAHALQHPDDIREVFRQIASPHLRLAFDYAHLERQKIPIEAAVRALAPYAVFVHLKDNIQTEKGWQFALPGQGTTDYPRLLVALKEAGYRGPICVEVSSQVFSKPGFNSKEAIASSWTALRPAFEKAGIIAVA